MTGTADPFLILQTGHPTAAMRRHGSFAHWIRVAAGLRDDDVVVIDVEHDEPLPTREGFAGVFVTGSAAMVTELLPWSEATAAWLRDAAHAGLPLLGICYGHQLLAHALGGHVGYNPAGREMGTVDIDLQQDAQDDALFAGLPAQFAVQATHLQTVLALPEGGRLLATSQQDAACAFRWGKCAWGVQFHPEFSTTLMRGYIRAKRGALADEGSDAAAMDSAVRATPRARQLLRRFVMIARNSNLA